MAAKEGGVRDLREQLGNGGSGDARLDEWLTFMDSDNESVQKLHKGIGAKKADLLLRDAELCDRNGQIRALREEIESLWAGLAEKDHGALKLVRRPSLEQQKLRQVEEARRADLEAASLQRDADGDKIPGLDRELSAKLSSPADLAQQLETQNAENQLLPQERKILNEEVYRLTRSLFEKQAAIEWIEQKMRDACEQHSTVEHALRTSNEQLSKIYATANKVLAALEAELSMTREELLAATEVPGSLERASEDHSPCSEMLEYLRRALNAKEEVMATSKDISGKKECVAQFKFRVVTLEISEAAFEAQEGELAALKSVLRSESRRKHPRKKIDRRTHQASHTPHKDKNKGKFQLPQHG